MKPRKCILFQTKVKILSHIFFRGQYKHRPKSQQSRIGALPQDPLEPLESPEGYGGVSNRSREKEYVHELLLQLGAPAIKQHDLLK